MSFTLKPTRMTVSDLRPSLSYRVGVPARSDAARHWVELAIADDPALFDPGNAAARRPTRFVTFRWRFPLPGADAVIHVPPAALLALAGAARLYAGAALFAGREGGAPLSVIRPDARSVYVDASGFTGAGLAWRFGFAARPGIAADVPLADAGTPIGWAGDSPEPGTAPFPSSRPGRPFVGAGAPAEGQTPMQQHQGFMHRGGQTRPMPAGQAPAPALAGAKAPGAAVDYDDGYGAPPPPLPPQGGQVGGQNGQPAMPQPVAAIPPGGAGYGNGNGQAPGYGNGNGQAHGYGNGNGQAPHHADGNGRAPRYANGNGQAHGYGNGNGQHPMPMDGQVGFPGQMPPGAGQPGHGGPQQPAPQAAQQAYHLHRARPLEYVLPRFDSYAPWDVIRTLADAWDRYTSFTAGVEDTSQFPFSAIVAIHAQRRRKSDNAVASFGGTGFYIGPNLLLTCAHNFAEDATWHAAHSAELFAGLNNVSGTNSPYDGMTLAQETVAASAVTIHPTYLSAATREQKISHDLAVVRVANAAPNNRYFRIADFTPAQDVKIAVCGYGLGSHAQGSTDFNWRQLLPAAQADWRQHMDADVIRRVVSNGEAFIYNTQTLAGNSGSPVFTRPGSNGGDPTQAMQVIAVHTRGFDDFHNYGVRLTPEKRDWALGFAGLASGQAHAGPMAYARPMTPAAAAGPAVWSAVGTGVGAAASAGVLGLAASTGDISWRVQRMEGWKAVGEHPVPQIPVPESRLHTSRPIELQSPYYSSMMGDMYANFTMTFKYDGTGVGGIAIDATPRTADTVGGGLRIDMQIEPLSESFPSRTATGQQVACVELRIFYTFEWTISDSDLVVVTYRFYGDGTYESSVRGGAASLEEVPATYTGYRR